MSDKHKLKGNIITPLRIIENGVFSYVGPQRADGGCIVTDYGDRYISPGFIDIHVHGGGGYDFMDCTREAFLGAARLHAAHGTATLLPTTLTCPDEELFELFGLFAQAKAAENDGAYLAGLHLEGPYFAGISYRRGASITKPYWKRPTAAFCAGAQRPSWTARWSWAGG